MPVKNLPLINPFYANSDGIEETPENNKALISIPVMYDSEIILTRYDDYFLVAFTIYVTYVYYLNYLVPWASDNLILRQAKST